MRPVYCTREQVKTALDSAETARNNRRIDRLIGASADNVDKLTKRVFYPWTGVRTLDWPPEWDPSVSWRLWLEDNELAAAPTSVTVDGVPIDITKVFPRPDTGPPFNRLELDRGSNTAWSAGSTPQRAIGVTGTFAGCPVVETSAAVLAADVTTLTVPTAVVGASWEVGVGSVLRVGSERMLVTGRSMVTTGQTVQVPMDAQLLSQQVSVVTGAGFVEDETIMVGAEKMRVDEISGNTLVVRRGWDGSAVATHASGSVIYAPRSLTVSRSACGTSPGTHTAGDAVWVFQPPGLVNQYAIAHTIVSLLNESAGYGRTVGSGDNEREAAGKALTLLEKRLVEGYRRYRVAAV
jgi:hypothetical protein